jgi:G:T/U-mismatch repair DNA glycosylase
MLPDLLRPGLRDVFVGTSVSTRSAAAGHYYSHPTNKFWQLLAHTGLPEGRPMGAPLDTAAASIKGDLKIEAWREFGSWVRKVAGTVD